MTKKKTTTTEPELDALQPALPTLELPDYHGQIPVGMKTALGGAGSRITKAHTIDDRCVFVIEGKVKFAGHESTEKGILYVERVAVVDLFELQGDQGARLLSTLRSMHRSAENATKGRVPIAHGDVDLGDVGFTDASGVVLTPAEVAELRGDPVRVILSPDLQPAVVVYDDGARNLWPDDYPKDTPRPKAGDLHANDGGAPSLVTKLLHHETGEELMVIEDPAGETVAVMTTTGTSLDPEWDGELGDAIAGWEDPSPLDGPETVVADTMPVLTAADYATVDAPLSTVTKRVAKETDVDVLRRMLAAEKAGRGRKLKPRAGAMTAIETRLASLEIVADLAPASENL